MSLTMPQIILLNHASWVNNKRMDAHAKGDEKGKSEPTTFNGKDISECSSNELEQYYAGFWGGM